MKLIDREKIKYQYYAQSGLSAVVYDLKNEIDHMPTVNPINGGSRDFATLCICAIRYCFGRKTYMPSLVQEIVLDNVDKISDNDLDLIIRDVEEMEEWDYGDPVIDKPNWVRFREEMKEEREKRKNE